MAKRSLRQQFNYYKKRYIQKLEDEQALRSVISNTLVDEIPRQFIKNLDFDKLYTEGTTRKVKGKTVRFTGDLAIRIQIESLQNRSNKTYQKNSFIENYLSSLRLIGFTKNDIDDIENAFKGISATKLSILIEKGILPPIQYLYSEPDSVKNLKSDIINAIKKGISRQEYSELYNKYKEMKPFIRKRNEILQR